MDAGDGYSVYNRVPVFNPSSMGTELVIYWRLPLLWCVPDFGEYCAGMQGDQSGPAYGMGCGRRLADRLRIADAAGADCQTLRNRAGPVFRSDRLCVIIGIIYCE